MDHLVSRCQRFTQYYAGEQTVDGKAQSLVVYTADSSPAALLRPFITPVALELNPGIAKAGTGIYARLQKNNAMFQPSMRILATVPAVRTQLNLSDRIHKRRSLSGVLANVLQSLGRSRGKEQGVDQ